MRTTRATAPGSPLPQHGPGGAGTSSSTSLSAGAQLELGGHRAAQLAELDGLVAQRHVGVEAAEVEQLAGQPRQAPQLALGALHLAAGVLLVEPAVAQVLLEQLDRALQRGQRRAQLVRRRRDERAPRRLLAAQLALHGGQRAGEVADLVEAVVARGRGVGALLGHAHRGGAQAREAPADAGRQADAEQDRDEQPDRGGGEEGVAHLVDGGRRRRVSCFCVTSTKSPDEVGSRGCAPG